MIEKKKEGATEMKSRPIVLAGLMFLGTTSIVSAASATCGRGQAKPDRSELTEYRSTLVMLRRAADNASRWAQQIGQRKVALALDQVSVRASGINASSYDPRLTCLDIARQKNQISMSGVYDAANRAPAMSIADQNAILGPVHNAMEDFFASAGVPKRGQ